MNGKKSLVTALCLAGLLVAAIPTLSSPELVYDPWLDTNDDGKIRVDDILAVALAYGADGQPPAKALLEYDSGWINITNKAGQNITVTHGLNVSDWNDESLMVDIIGRTTFDGPLHRSLGHYEQRGWNKTYGGTNTETAYDLVKTIDGGYALIGQTASFGAGGYDFWLVKTDSLGNHQWNKTFGGTGAECAFGLVAKSDGGYAIAGRTDSLGAGGRDFWLVRADPSGNDLWNQTYGGTVDEESYALIETSDGGYALAGYTASFGAGNWDIWLVKTDSLGNAQWNKTYGGPGTDLAWTLAETSDGGYAIAGYTFSYGAGGRDMWLIKTDSMGNHQWNMTYGGTDYDEARALVQTSDGGYAMAGCTKSFGAGHYDSWLVRTDANGNAVWNRTHGGGNEDHAWALIQTRDGGHALAGFTYSYGAGSCDLWLVKTDTTGNALWNKTYGGTGMEVAMALVETSDGEYALMGYANLFVGGNFDFWLVKTDFVSSFSWIGSTANTIVLYRGSADLYWNFVRVRIWKPRQTP